MSIYDAIRERVQHPDALAITSAGQQYTFNELFAAVAATRNWLRTHHATGVPIIARIRDPFATAVVALASDAAGVPVIHNDAATLETPFATLFTDGPPTPACTDSIGIAGLFVHRRDATLTLPDRSQTFMTSGSTGTPVGIVREADAVVADAERVAQFLEYGSDTHTVVIAPLFHAYGFNYGLIATLLAGVPARYLPPQSLASSIIRAAAGARILIGLPFHHELLGTSYSKLPSLTKVVSAGAPLASGVAAAITAIESLTLYNCYGSSEVGAVTLSPVTGEEAHGDVGVPLPGISVRTDGDELLVRSTSAAWGRLRAGEINPLPMDSGWYRTGDIAQLSEGNRVVLAGRLDSVINVAGKKVHPMEIEQVLSAHPAVVAVHVGAEKDTSRGQVPIARLILREAVEIPELLRWCSTRLAPHQQPRRIDIVDELPRSATGKITTAFAQKEIR